MHIGLPLPMLLTVLLGDGVGDGVGELRPRLLLRCLLSGIVLRLAIGFASILAMAGTIVACGFNEPWAVRNLQEFLCSLEYASSAFRGAASRRLEGRRKSSP